MGKTTIFALLADGSLPYVRVTPAGDRRIPRRALIEYASSRLVARER